SNFHSPASQLQCLQSPQRPTTHIPTLSLHDALPISWQGRRPIQRHVSLNRPMAATTPKTFGSAFSRKSQLRRRLSEIRPRSRMLDRKSTRLNSSHGSISYAVFCLKKKKLYHIIVSIM